MGVTRCRKLAIISLAICWPALFVLTHMPMPEEVKSVELSDKILHFLAYATLVFLLWIALNPERKVRWQETTVWWVLLTVVAYGIIDEFLQGYVGRSCEVMDFVSDLAGAFTSCIILTFFTFWPAAVILGALLICGLTNITPEGLAGISPIGNAMFHLFSYAVFTLLWIHCMRLFDSLRTPKAQWLIAALALPTALLLVVKGYSISLGREFPMQDIVLSVGGIVAVVGVVSAAVLFGQRAAQGLPGSDG
jgi:VanZ family protein